MSIKEEYVEITVSGRVIPYYERLGYKIEKRRDRQGRLGVPRGTKLTVKVTDLPRSSNVNVTKVCDRCSKEVPNQTVNLIMKCRKNNLDYCKECSYQNMRNTKLTSTKLEKSFGVKNKHLVKMWHPDNKLTPYNISHQSPRKMKFNCFYDRGHVFYSQVRHVSNGVKCPICNSSRGENAIRDYFVSKGIPFEMQVTFSGLRGVNGGDLYFDFRVGEILIEFDGIQHFEPVDFKGLGKEHAERTFEIQQEHDRRKNDFCKRHSIELVRIKYDELDNIKEILDKLFSKSPNTGDFFNTKKH